MSRRVDLREWIEAVTAGWSHRRLLTLTVDRKGTTSGCRGFVGPGEAFDYVAGGRYVAELMRRYGFTEWIAVLELQRDGWPHWHVLVNTAWANFGVLWKWWRDTWGIGGGDWDQRVTSSSSRAARYLTKYLSKGVGELPQWFLDRNVRGVSCGRGVQSFEAWKRSSRGLAPRVARQGVKPSGVTVRVRASVCSRLKGCGRSSHAEFVTSRGCGEAAEFKRERIVAKLPSADVLRRLAVRLGVPHSVVLGYRGRWRAQCEADRGYVLRSLGDDRELPLTRRRVFVRELELSLDAWCHLESFVPSLRRRLTPLGGAGGGKRSYVPAIPLGAPTLPPPWGVGVSPTPFPPQADVGDPVGRAPSPASLRRAGVWGVLPPRTGP